uniref:Branched-chain-amino-acid aminotransferase n=1 Tax=Macaca fascicularis TaxID=9541 RepID=I7GLH9_MACFA|nr:unnamed protein product [Macaca fascicularis]
MPPAPASMCGLCSLGTSPRLGVAQPTSALLFVILCPVGAYFPGGSVTPVSLLADPTFIRAWVGGVGNYKLGGNYGPTVLVQQEARKQGCEQVLWLYGPDHQLTEVGTMNIFIYWTHEDGVLELVTPPLNGVILPGVVRQSLLDLAQTWGEFRVAERTITMKQLLRALEEGRVREVFGSGTACQVCPVHRILYKDKNLHIPTMENGPELILRFQKELKEIQVSCRQPGNGPGACSLEKLVSRSPSLLAVWEVDYISREPLGHSSVGTWPGTPQGLLGVVEQLPPHRCLRCSAVRNRSPRVDVPGVMLQAVLHIHRPVASHHASTYLPTNDSPEVQY